MSDITAELVALADLTDPIATLANTKSRQWQEQLSDTGSASLEFQNDDADLATVEGAKTAINYYLRGEPAFTMLCEQFHAVIVSQDEEAAQTTVWSGRGHVAVLDRAVIYPSGGVGKIPIQEDRVFNWRAPEYDDSGWVSAVNIEVVGDAKPAGPAPWYMGVVGWADDFPDDTAQILWGSYIVPGTAAVGYVYARQVFSTTLTGPHILFVAADNAAEFYIDGVLVLTTDDFTFERHVTVDLTAGSHVLAWAGSNTVGYPGFDNPAGVSWVLAYPAYPLAIAAHSDSAIAVISDYPPEAPGMTPGEAFLIVLAEAQARAEAGSPILNVTCSFDADVDTDGTPWDITPNIATKVGTSLLTFAKELSATYWDFYMAPGTWVLDAWVLGARDSGGTFAFAAEVNLTSYEQQGEA